MAVHTVDLPGNISKFVENLLETLNINIGCLFDSCKLLMIVLQLFDDIRLDIGPGKDIDDVQQTIDRGTTGPSPLVERGCS